MSAASELPLEQNQKYGDEGLVSGDGRSDMISYLESMFRSAIDDDQNVPTLNNEHDIPIIASAEEAASVANFSSDDSSAKYWSESSESEDSSPEYVPQRKRKFIANQEKLPSVPHKSIKFSEPTVNRDISVNVVIPIFTCSHDDTETLLRKEHHYIRACVRTHQSHFSKTARIVLWRQLGVELGYSFVALVLMGEKLVGEVTAGKTYVFIDEQFGCIRLNSSAQVFSTSVFILCLFPMRHRQIHTSATTQVSS
jgi:hypothetical protein